MGTVKDRNGMVLTEAEDIKKRWQEYTEELYTAATEAQRALKQEIDRRAEKLSERRARGLL